MAEDKSLKTAFELAMERLRKRDEEAGIEQRPVTDEQKAAIADLRSLYRAKIAEHELLHQSRRLDARDPIELAAYDEEFRLERERLVAEREEKIETIRRSPV